MSVTGKKILKSGITGEQGVNLIQRVILDMGFLWHPTGSVEAGIDGFIELRDPTTEFALNAFVSVQSKATAGSFQAETDLGFDYSCDDRDLQYWLQGNAPVILVVSRPSTNEAYWAPIKEYFKDLDKRLTRKIHFDKRVNRFDHNCAAALASLAVSRDAGIHLAPRPKFERLYSNLIRVVHFSESIHIAETEYRKPEHLWGELRRLGGNVSGAWILKSRQIVAFDDLREYPWSHVCDAGSVDDFETKEWADSPDPEKHNDFLQLLNRCLREKAWSLWLRYDQVHDCYFFKATADLSPRKIRYRSLMNEAERTVFQGYPSKVNPDKMAFYRHSAFQGHFLKYDSQWYLEVTPTYHFTWNGERPHLDYGEKLKGIKRLEKNPAVVGQLVMWAEYLSRPPDMFTRDYPFLRFGDIETFETDSGIEDRAWLGQEEKAEADAIEASLGQLPLFGP
ncbi:MAG: DUF4365 domain-containing protein [Dehalococcoidia bacterium]|nr:DUF4365 domain-containing protein [Dehalococcoidia bacterium]